jgi:hypothetical protein
MKQKTKQPTCFVGLRKDRRVPPELSDQGQTALGIDCRAPVGEAGDVTMKPKCLTEVKHFIGYSTLRSMRSLRLGTESIQPGWIFTSTDSTPSTARSRLSASVLLFPAMTDFWSNGLAGLKR